MLKRKYFNTFVSSVPALHPLEHMLFQSSYSVCIVECVEQFKYQA